MQRLSACLQDIIDDYDDQGIRMARPLRKKRSRKEKPEAFLRDTADASASESAGYDSNVDVGAIKQELRDRGNKGDISLNRGWTVQAMVSMMLHHASCAKLAIILVQHAGFA